MRTAYLAVDSNSNHHSMSMSFDFTTDIITYSFDTHSSGHSSQKRTRTLTPTGALTQRIESCGGGSTTTDTFTSVPSSHHPYWPTNFAYSSESHSSHRWSIDGDFTSNYYTNYMGGACFHSPNIRNLTRTDNWNSSNSRTENGETTTSSSSSDTTITGSDSTLTKTLSESSGDGSASGSYNMSGVLGWLAGQIAPSIPGINVTQQVVNLINGLVTKYHSWDNVPQELKDLIGAYLESDVGDPSSQAEYMQALIRALYTRMHERDPASEGVPDLSRAPASNFQTYIVV